MTEVLTDYFNSLLQSFLTTLNTPEDYINKLVLTAVIVVISLLLRLMFKKMIVSNVCDRKNNFKFQKIMKSSIITLTVITVLFIWIQAMNVLVLLALLFGVFIVFMVRGLTSNIIGYFVITYNKYFKIGDRVEINDIIGDVMEINPVSFHLLEVRNWLSSDSNTGRIIKLPNKIIFEESIEMVGAANEFIWHEVKYLLSFDSDWQAAEKIMKNAGDAYFNQTVVPQLKENNENAPNKLKKLEPVFSLNTNEDGIVLVLRYLIHYKSGTKVRTHLQRTILSKFDKNTDIKFATVDIRILPT